VRITCTIGNRLYPSRITSSFSPEGKGPWKSADITHHGAVGKGDGFSGSGLYEGVTA